MEKELPKVEELQEEQAEALPQVATPSSINKWLLVAVLAAGVALLVGIAIFVYFVFLSPSQNQAYRPEPQTLQADTTISAEEALRQKAGDWETYTSKNGYFLKYPPTWKIMTGNAALELLIKSPQGEVINVFRQTNPNSLSLAAFLEQNLTQEYASSFADIAIGGRDAKRANKDRIVYVLMPTNEILTINYLSCSGPDCEVSSLSPETFDVLLATLEFSQ